MGLSCRALNKCPSEGGESQLRGAIGWRRGGKGVPSLYGRCCNIFFDPSFPAVWWLPLPRTVRTPLWRVRACVGRMKVAGISFLAPGGTPRRKSWGRILSRVSPKKRVRFFSQCRVARPHMWHLMDWGGVTFAREHYRNPIFGRPIFFPADRDMFGKVKSLLVCLPPIPHRHGV